MGSLFGYSGWPENGSYGASKAAVINLAETLKLELEWTGVDLTLINPGFVDTSLNAAYPREKKHYLMSPRKAAKRILDRLGRRPYEIAFPGRVAFFHFDPPSGTHTTVIDLQSKQIVARASIGGSPNAADYSEQAGAGLVLESGMILKGRRHEEELFVINVARGLIVDEPALVSALKEERIAGAALDVFEVEPLPANHPLWTMPNVVITPHTAPASPWHIRRGTELFLENLRRFRAGQELLNIVDPADVGVAEAARRWDAS